MLTHRWRAGRQLWWGMEGMSKKQKENELDMDNSVMIMWVSGGERGCRGDKW